jgi:hypothetical protein
METKQIKYLLDNATYSVDEFNSDLYTVDFSKVKLAAISVTANSIKEAKSKAAEWFNDPTAARQVSEWRDTLKPTKSEK